VGRALTLGAIVNSYVSATESNLYASNDNPGKRTGGLDMTYRLPYMRDWLSIYLDSISPNDASPLSAPRRAGINPGIYLTHFPKLQKLDFRIEAVNTDTPSSGHSGHITYWDIFYHDLATNNGNLIGSWVGREGRAVEAWTTYWFSPRNTVELAYRNARVSDSFIPFGETVNDGSVKVNWLLRQNVSFSASIQYERWVAPLLAPNPQTNWTSSVELTFWPHAETRPSSWLRRSDPADGGN
jgi:hypothetical protein